MLHVSSCTKAKLDISGDIR